MLELDNLLFVYKNKNINIETYQIKPNKNYEIYAYQQRTFKIKYQERNIVMKFRTDKKVSSAKCGLYKEIIKK